MSEFLVQTRVGRTVKSAAEWPLIAFMALMAFVSTLRTLGILS